MSVDIDTIGQTAHAVSAVWTEYSTGEPQPAWSDLDQHTQDSVIEGVAFVLDNHSPETPVTPEACHDNWLEFKQFDGWKYGPIKDAEKKEHPCILPFDALPRWQQFKDKLFVTVVLAAAGN